MRQRIRLICMICATMMSISLSATDPIEFALTSAPSSITDGTYDGLVVNHYDVGGWSSSGANMNNNKDYIEFDLSALDGIYIDNATVYVSQGGNACSDSKTHLLYTDVDGGETTDLSLSGTSTSLQFTITPVSNCQYLKLQRGCANGTYLKNLVLNVRVGVSISGTNLNQNITLADAITNIVVTAGESCDFEATGLPSGVSLSTASGTTTTLSGTPAVAGTYNFTVTATSTADDSKTGSVSGKIIVTSGAILSLENGTQSGTVGSAISTITATSNKATTTWAVTGLPSGLSLSSASGSEVTITGTPTQSGVFAYTLRGTYGGVTNDLNGTLTIAAKAPALNITNDDQEVAQGTAITSMVVTSDSTVAWSIDCLPPGLVAIASPDSMTFTISGIPTTVETYDFVITGRSVKHTKSTNINGRLTVSEEVVTCNNPTIDTQPVAEEDYAGQEMTLTVTASDDEDTGVLSYQWYSNTTSSTAGSTTLVGETSATLSQTPSTPGVTYYYCVVTNTCGLSTRKRTTTDIVSMTANCVARSISITSDDYDITTEESANLTVTYSPVAATGGTVSWTVSPVTGSVSDGVFTATAGGTYSVSASVAASGIYCAVSSTAMASTIGVTSTTCDAPSITVQPVTQNVNKGSTTTLSVTASGSGTLSYQWYRNTTASTTAATLIAGAESSSYTVPTATEGTVYYYCVVSNYCSDLDLTTPLTSNIVGVTVHCIARSVTLNVTPLSISIDESSIVSASVTAGSGDIGYSVNNVNGSVVAGSFSATAAGPYVITASVAANGNYCAASNTKTVNVTAPSAPEIHVSPSSARVQDLLLGESMTTLTFSADEAVTYTTTGTITGVTVTDNGDNTLTISGTPTVEADDQTITVKARNAGGVESTMSVVLNVSAASSALSCGALHCKNFTIPAAETYSLNLYNGGGSKVKTIYSATMTSGDIQIIFQTNDLANGTYTYKFETASTVVDSGTIVVNNE